jgi:hypothetical protein
VAQAKLVPAFTAPYESLDGRRSLLSRRGTVTSMLLSQS